MVSCDVNELEEVDFLEEDYRRLSLGQHLHLQPFVYPYPENFGLSFELHPRQLWSWSRFKSPSPQLSIANLQARVRGIIVVITIFNSNQNTLKLKKKRGKQSENFLTCNATRNPLSITTGICYRYEQIRNATQTKRLFPLEPTAENSPWNS